MKMTLPSPSSRVIIDWLQIYSSGSTLIRNVTVALYALPGLMIPADSLGELISLPPVTEDGITPSTSVTNEPFSLVELGIYEPAPGIESYNLTLAALMLPVLVTSMVYSTVSPPNINSLPF